MQNVAQGTAADNPKIDKVNVHHDIGNLPSTPHSTNSSPTKSETETYSEHRQYMSDSSESEEDSVSEVESFVIDQEYEEDPQVEAAKFLLSAQEDRTVDPETQARLEALLQAAGIGQLATKDGKHLADPEVLRRLTSSVSSALDEAAAALTRMRSDTSQTHAQIAAQQQQQQQQQQPEKTSLVEACTDGDVCTVRKLLTEGRSVHETSEDGESLLSLACSAGYFELAQVLLAMHANVEDRGIKGECTPLMEAASAGHLDIVKLLVAHGADVNAQSTSGNTPLMYGCAGGHQEVVKFLLEHGANVEDHNENGHTPLMEAASAGHVGLAKILLLHGAGINTHSNEFKESALTLACYKGHLDMVKFLLEAGADQEHKTDEMHTALMEASMDGHVEVARLLLDSGAQVNMPTDSFESPLTLAACGGHVDLAMLLIERGANIEEVNDEGYTPLMEAAREGHEDMVALLLSQGANINAQTDETQETALTLACCGGFTEVADFLIKAGADIELGASTPLMEAAQEGHLELVKYLLENNANVHAQTQTGDTALTYACENGHTDVADLLLQFDSDLEHESEGGRTPLMKACRAGHLCTVQFLISKGANVRRQTTNNDHTPLSLACAGGHLPVVELLLVHRADPSHKLKDNSTMLIEAAKGGHTNVVQLLLDYPHSMIMNQPASTTATNLLPGQVGSRDSPLPSNLPQPLNFFHPPPDFSPAVLQEVPEAVRIIAQEDSQQPGTVDLNKQVQTNQMSPTRLSAEQNKDSGRHNLQAKGRTSAAGSIFDGNLTSAEAQQVRTQPLSLGDLDDCEVYAATATMEFLAKQDPGFIETNKSILEYVKNRKKQTTNNTTSNPVTSSTDEGSTQKKQQILEELHRVDREFNGKQQAHNPLFPYAMTVPQDETSSNTLPHTLNIDITMQQQQQQQQGLGSAGMSNSMFSSSVGNLQVQSAFYTGPACLQSSPTLPLKLTVGGSGNGEPSTAFATNQNQQPAFYFAPLNSSVAVPLSATTGASNVNTQPIKFQTVTSHAEVSQNTAISDRPKAKPVSKKEGKNLRKQQQQYPSALYNQPMFNPNIAPQSLHPASQQQQLAPQPNAALPMPDKVQETLQGLDLDHLEQDSFSVLKDDAQENLLTASILQQFHNSPQINTIRAEFVGPITNDTKNQQRKAGLELYDRALKEATCKFMEQRAKFMREDLVEGVVSTIDCHNEITDNLQLNPYSGTLDENMIATLAAQQELTGQTEVSRVEYFAVPSNSAQLPVQQSTFEPYEHYLQAVGNINKADYQAGFQAGISLMQHTLACPNAAAASTTETMPTVVPATSSYVQPSQPGCVPTSCTHIGPTTLVQTTHHCQVPCSQHHQTIITHQQQQQPAVSHQVQAATQTPQTTTANEGKKSIKSTVLQESLKKKSGRLLYRHQQQGQQPNNAFQNNQNYQIDPNSAITQYGSSANQCVTAAAAQPTNYCMDVDSETESNHDTALTLACAGGHEELVELLIARGADIEHRDKKGFTPLILAATAGHEKVVEILIKNSADIEAQSERTKDTPLSLACSGGRYEVVEILLNKNANKEHRNVSDYTPLSLAASGGYVNIIKLLLNHGAEINSRTGSKLGISPLMLAAMNGHTAAVKLLLDMGSDINAQIETNRNTALTLACFQGRHEVVSLLLDRKANVEHRAKTGLTPLMEAASGGYVEVGRVLLDKGAEVNATPVPSSRDTALTIAADKGHVRFVELLLCRGAAVEVKNKKGNSPLWLAANGGHLNVVELLYNLSADIDSQDNRKVSCLMAAFRKGHTKVVKWMVIHVSQFPSDQEMIRYISTVSDKELLEKCQECVKIIRAAKETQAAKANKNASILLEELDMEKNREESKKAAAARRRERKKKKKLEKKEEKRKLNEENKKNEDYDEKNDKCDDDDDKGDDEENQENTSPIRNGETSADKEEGDSGIDANSQGSCSSNDVKSKEKRKDKKKKKNSSLANASKNENRSSSVTTPKAEMKEDKRTSEKQDNSKKVSSSVTQNVRKGLMFDSTRSPAERDDFEATGNDTFVSSKTKKSSHNHEFESVPVMAKVNSSTSPKQSGKREDGWKEVVRKSSVQTVSTSESGVKKVSVPLNAISRVIGRGGSNINAIRGATGAHIEVEKQSKGQGERIITIKGTADATKQAHSLIAILIRDPDVDILQMLPKANKIPAATTLWDKTQIGTKKVAGKVLTSQTTTVTTTTSQQKSVILLAPVTAAPLRFKTTTITARPTSTAAPRVASRTVVSQPERNPPISIQTSRIPTSHTPTIPTTATRSNIKIITTSANQTFAAKLTEITSANSQLFVSVNSIPRAPLTVPQNNIGPVSPQNPAPPLASNQSSPKHHNRPVPTSSAPPNMQHFLAPGKNLSTTAVSACTGATCAPDTLVLSQPCSPTPMLHNAPNTHCQDDSNIQPTTSVTTTQVYSLFNTQAQQPMWRREHESQKPANFAAVTGGGSSQSMAQSKFVDDEPPPQVDAAKAPGYRGTAVCSPVSSSKTSSNSTTPPNLPLSSSSNFHNFTESKGQPLPPIGSGPHRPAQNNQQNDVAHFYGNDRSMQHMGHTENNHFKGAAGNFGQETGPILQDTPLLQAFQGNSMQHMNYSQPQQQPQTMSAVSMSRLNPKAPDFSSSMHLTKNQMYNGYQNTYPAPIAKPLVPNFNRSAVGSTQTSWPLMQMQQPFNAQQTDIISGMSSMAGMTIHNIARATDAILDNGDLASSPAMSPSIQPAMLLNENHYIEDRKPQPIGTGRSRKNFTPIENNWMMENDMQRQWTRSNNIDPYAIPRNPIYSEDMHHNHIMDSGLQHGIPLETNFNIRQQFFYTQAQQQPQQQQMSGMQSHDFAPDLKNDISWDGRQSMAELHEKQRRWSGLTNRWNQ